MTAENDTARDGKSQLLTEEMTTGTEELERQRAQLLEALKIAIHYGQGPMQMMDRAAAMPTFGGKVESPTSQEDVSPHQLTESPEPENSPPSPEQMAQHFGVSIEELPGILKQQIAEVQNSIERCRSLFTPKKKPNRADRRRRKLTNNVPRVR